MLSYELCKKLKEAGLDQGIKNYSPNLYYKKNADGSVESGQAFYPKLSLPDGFVKEPTLSELIEACDKIILFWDGAQWVAGTPGSEGGFGKSGAEGYWIRDTMEVMAVGDTPESAMCNLYLALNPKP